MEKDIRFLYYYFIPMDGLTRAIDVRDIFKECMECPNRGLKETTTACRNCIYKILSDKIECEKKAYSEREKKQNENP